MVPLYSIEKSFGTSFKFHSNLLLTKIKPSFSYLSIGKSLNWKNHLAMMAKRATLEYATSHNQPQQSTTTHNYPQPSTTTHNHSQPPKTIHNQPQPAKTTHNHPQPATTSHNHSQSSTTTQKLPKKATTCYKQSCYCT